MGYNTSESAGKYFLLGLTTIKRMATHDLWKYMTYRTMSTAFSIIRVTNSTSSVGVHPTSISPGGQHNFSFQ